MALSVAAHAQATQDVVAGELAQEVGCIKEGSMQEGEYDDVFLTAKQALNLACLLADCLVNLLRRVEGIQVHRLM